jgi:glycosyltransferase involved in cell wall biosynthesis
MVQVANELAYRGYRIELILVEASGPYRSLVDSSVQTTEIGGGNTLSILYRLWRHLQVSPPDVLFSTMEIPNIVSVLSTRYPAQISAVLRIANVNSAKKREGRFKLIPSLKRLTYPHAEAIITISDGVAHDLADITGINEDELSTIHNPAFDPTIPQKASEEVDHPWLNDETKQVIIGVGNMKPQKDFSTLLRAIHHLQEDQHLIILGRGDGKPALKELATSLGIADRVSFPGFVENPYAYMARADVFALSSAWEGFGNVIVEAMACGTPVVCTDCPGGPAEILNDGEYGPLVPVGDHEALATAIQHMLESPTDPDKLVNRARAFSIEKIVDEYEHVLRSVVE